MKAIQEECILPDKRTDAEKLAMALEELRMAYAERRVAYLAPSQCRLVLVAITRAEGK